MLLADDLDSVRVISKAKAREVLSLSENTWDRMEARGELPPATQLSPRRVGYRIIDLKNWLDARRVGQAA